MRIAVRPELVEGPVFFSSGEEGQDFDKLSPNGFWARV
jgi:hypothetical protein